MLFIKKKKKQFDKKRAIVYLRQSNGKSFFNDFTLYIKRTARGVFYRESFSLHVEYYTKRETIFHLECKQRGNFVWWQKKKIKKLLIRRRNRPYPVISLQNTGEFRGRVLISMMCTQNKKRKKKRVKKQLLEHGRLYTIIIFYQFNKRTISTHPRWKRVVQNRYIPL